MTALTAPTAPEDANPEPPSLPKGLGRALEAYARKPNAASHNVVVLEIRGPFNAQAMRLALTRLVQVHEGLRCALAQAGAREIRLLPGEFDLREIDLSKRSPSSRRERARDLVSKEFKRRFSLTGEWPIRATLLRHGGAYHQLVLTTLHYFVDGFSLGILMRDLLDFYEQLVAGASAGGPRAPTKPYPALAQLEKDLDSSAGKILQPIELACVPVSRNPHGHSTRSEVLTLSTAEVRKLRQAAQACGVSLASLMTTGLALACWSRTQGRAVMLQTTWSGRTEETFDVVGPLWRRTYLQAPIDSQSTLGQLCQRLVFEFLKSTRTIQTDTAFFRDAVIQMELRQKHAPLLLNYVGDPDTPMQRRIGKSDLCWSIVDPVFKRAFPPLIFVESTPKGGQVRVKYTPSVCTRATVRHLLSRYGYVLRRMARQGPQIEIAKLLKAAPRLPGEPPQAVDPMDFAETSHAV